MGSAWLLDSPEYPKRLYCLAPAWRMFWPYLLWMLQCRLFLCHLSYPVPLWMVSDPRTESPSLPSEKLIGPLLGWLKLLLPHPSSLELHCSGCASCRDDCLLKTPDSIKISTNCWLQLSILWMRLSTLQHCVSCTLSSAVTSRRMFWLCMEMEMETCLCSLQGAQSSARLWNLY